MKLQLALVGLLCCFGALAQDQKPVTEKSTSQSANRIKRPAATIAQSLTGCVDQRGPQYIMRDEQTSQIVTLQASGTDDDSMFAKFVGHKVKASGSGDSTTLKVTGIAQVADMCGTSK